MTARPRPLSLIPGPTSRSPSRRIGEIRAAREHRVEVRADHDGRKVRGAESAPDRRCPRRPCESRLRPQSRNRRATQRRARALRPSGAAICAMAICERKIASSCAARRARAAASDRKVTAVSAVADSTRSHAYHLPRIAAARRKWLCSDMTCNAMNTVPTTTVGRARLGRNVYALGAVSFFTDVSSEMIYPLLPVFLTTVPRRERRVHRRDRGRGGVDGGAAQAGERLVVRSRAAAQAARRRRLRARVGGSAARGIAQIGDAGAAHPRRAIAWGRGFAIRRATRSSPIRCIRAFAGGRSAFAARRTTPARCSARSSRSRC